MSIGERRTDWLFVCKHIDFHTKTTYTISGTVMIFNVQRFSTHDGPGIRTVVFLKGCPLRCPWCENPESQSLDPELMYDAGLCIGCLDCAAVAPDGEVRIEAGRPRFARERISQVSLFRGACPAGALSVVGEERVVDQIVREVEKDIQFYGEEGGATLSGGEPYAQARFAADLVEALREKHVDTVVETSLQAPWSSIEPTLTGVSLFLADLKHTNPLKYHEATGGRLAVVLENFRRLEKAGARVIVRVPVVPDFNDDSQELRSILRFAASLENVEEVHLLPYHTLGNGKYALLGREVGMPGVSTMPQERLAPYIEVARSLGLQATIGG